MKCLKYLLLLALSTIIFLAKSQMVYEVSQPGFAEVKYCVVDSPIFADVVVFKAPNPSYTEIKENRGVWYFCPNQSMANITLCQTPEIEAQLKVYFTDSVIFAQWNNPEKKRLMTPQNY